MSGSSNSESTTTKEFKPTSQTNPFYTTTTDKNGNTVTNFQKGTAGETAYNFVNKNLSTMLNNYLHPTLNSETNQAKLQAFNQQQQANLQNNIISPLAQSNMLRSSQATNMYNNLSNQAADYSRQLLAEDQANSKDMLNFLMSMYTNAYSGANGEESLGINASLGGGNSTTKTSGKAG
jgi:hypothetical protein